MTRRGLLGAGLAGAGALAAGCGTQPGPEARPRAALGRLARAQWAAAEAYDGWAPGRGRPEVAAMARAARRRAEAVTAAGGARPASVPRPGSPVAAERAALRAYVEALPDLPGDALRTLAADGIRTAAAHDAVLSALTGRPPARWYGT